MTESKGASRRAVSCGEHDLNAGATPEGTVMSMPGAPGWKQASVALPLSLATACTSETGPGRTPAPTKITSSAVAPPAVPTAETMATSVSPTAPADPQEADAQVRSNWSAFFNPSTTMSRKADLLQDGHDQELFVEGFTTDERIRRVKAIVDQVTFRSDVEAEVRYTLAGNEDDILLADATGTAVLQDDVWKVSLRTLCGLLKPAPSAPQPAVCAQS
ncbi:hypothetical protein [Nonomuraea sp. GTA35]|uniref:hypothetical protein n=1 Tax=Nonomuraea sp. GTA35 TaxID=1676746 RepID=UPI0035C0B4A9